MPLAASPRRPRTSRAILSDSTRLLYCSSALSPSCAPLLYLLLPLLTVPSRAMATGRIWPPPSRNRESPMEESPHLSELHTELILPSSGHHTAGNRSFPFPQSTAAAMATSPSLGRLRQYPPRTTANLGFWWVPDAARPLLLPRRRSCRATAAVWPRRPPVLVAELPPAPIHRAKVRDELPSSQGYSPAIFTSPGLPHRRRSVRSSRRPAVVDLAGH